MDPRQPQQPFSRNTASPYGRTPFHPSSNQAPFAQASHPPPNAPSYAEHNRRPSDPPYYNNSQRSYGSEGPSMSGPGHARHQSASSVGHGTPVNRNMLPPSSPQQQASQQPSHHQYGPPPPRAPPVSVGPPTSFPSRELPSLPPLGRPASNGASSMSISSMLGGPPPAAREPPPSHYASPVTTSAPPPPPAPSVFGQSPRMTSAAQEYASFRRPMTPEHQRSYEPRDARANSAGSPPNMTHYSTPESRRLGTPQQQGYGQRVMDERREPMRVPNPNVPPPRPNSQPSGFNPPQRISDNPRPIGGESIFGRKTETRPAPEYAHGSRPAFEERHAAYGYAERERRERHERQEMQERQEREAAIQREREEAIRREREQRDRLEHDHAMQQREREYAHQMASRNPQNYSRPPPEPREQPAWMRQNHEPPRPQYERPPYDQTERPPPQQVQNGYDYPATTAPQYGGPPAYAPPEPRPVDHRYGPPPPPPVSVPPPQHNVPLAAHYEASERERMVEAQRRQQQQPMYGGPQGYQPHESPQRRPVEEQIQQQRNLLSVQEINRRGRASPLPQAVQGAQHQINGPGGEPSIKNEFGRMFSGIGSGVGAMASPVSSGVQGLPFSNSGQARRDDLESLQDSPVENGGGHQLARTSSRGGRRRKLKEEDSKGDDESSTGRLTPSGRGKRAKNHHHRPHHHHHHRAEQMENMPTSSPSQSHLTPFKSVRGSTIPSPPGPEGKSNPNLHHHHVPRPHVHHHVTPTKPVNPIIPLPKVTVNSQVVLDSVSNRTRDHLGHAYYRSTLSASSAVKRDRMSDRGFASYPQPLPRFEGQENCTYTIKIPATYLDDKSREEITARRAVWGTDIYTDDSDIIAACIHQGWFRGAWNPDVDVSLLDLEIEVEGNGAVLPPVDSDALITSPPATGPMHVPKNRDCHVTILVLPLLQKYSSLTRFGIKSREWGAKRDGYQSVHDGLSFMIMSIRWVKGVDGEEKRNGKTKKTIFDEELNDKELEAEKAFNEFFYHGNGRFRGSDNFKESFERGSSQPARMGMGTANWMKGGKDTGKPQPPAPEPEPRVPTPPPASISAPVAPAATATHTALPVQILVPTGPLPAPVVSRHTTPPRHTIPLSFSPPTPEPLSPIAPKGVEVEVSPEITRQASPSPSQAVARSEAVPQASPLQAAQPQLSLAQALPPPVSGSDLSEVIDTEATQLDKQISAVTERMIENANMGSPLSTPTAPPTASVPIPEAETKKESDEARESREREETALALATLGNVKAEQEELQVPRPAAIMEQVGTNDGNENRVERSVEVARDGEKDGEDTTMTG